MVGERKKPFSSLELLNQARMKATSQFLSPLKLYIKLGYEQMALKSPGVGAFQLAQAHVRKDAITYDAEFFCLDVIEAVHDWYNQMKDDPNVRANLPNLVHFRPLGFAPYVVGQPIIA